MELWGEYCVVRDEKLYYLHSWMILFLTFKGSNYSDSHNSDIECVQVRIQIHFIIWNTVFEWYLNAILPEEGSSSIEVGEIVEIGTYFLM
jgi:hypothetical protein